MGFVNLRVIVSILRLVVGIIAWINMTRALESVFAPPQSRRAARLKLLASLCFVAGASLLLIAALLWTVDHTSRIQNVVGYCGLAALLGFLFLGGLCQRENGRGWAREAMGSKNR